MSDHNAAVSSAAEERAKRLRAEHEAYLNAVAKGTKTLHQMQSSIAGASSKTSENYRHAEAREHARQAAMDADEAHAAKVQAFEAEAEARKASLEEQRNRNKKKRDKKKNKGAKRSRSGSRSSADGSDVEAPKAEVVPEKEASEEAVGAAPKADA